MLTNSDLIIPETAVATIRGTFFGVKSRTTTVILPAAKAVPVQKNKKAVIKVFRNSFLFIIFYLFIAFTGLY